MLIAPKIELELELQIKVTCRKGKCGLERKDLFIQSNNGNILWIRDECLDPLSLLLLLCNFEILFLMYNY